MILKSDFDFGQGFFEPKFEDYRITLNDKSVTYKIERRIYGAWILLADGFRESKAEIEERLREFIAEWTPKRCFSNTEVQPLREDFRIGWRNSGAKIERRVNNQWVAVSTLLHNTEEEIIKKIDDFVNNWGIDKRPD